MSDLISRSELYMNDLIRRKDVLALFPTNDCSDKMVGLYERVLDIPTAYDMEKVVAELEVNTIYDGKFLSFTSKFGIGFVSKNKALEILRKGGAK